MYIFNSDFFFHLKYFSVPVPPSVRSVERLVLGCDGKILRGFCSSVVLFPWPRPPYSRTSRRRVLIGGALTPQAILIG